MTAHFEPALEIATIQGADYNPRVISDASFENLKKSIAVLGAVKPILVNDQNRIIIAGHQRTKAMRALGVTHVPAMMMDNVNLADEMRFNQFHNATDENFADVGMQVRGLKGTI